MEREVLWAPWEGPGLEHLRVSPRDEEITADGLIIGVAGGRPFRARYAVRCDARWRVREVRVTTLGSGHPGIGLLADGEGRWMVASGEAVPALDGCIDVDLSATPFTNTLPIRRLGLSPGATAELAVAYIDVPALRLAAVRQRYACLDAQSDGGRYRYESLPNDSLPDGFTAELPVDADGLVLDYPGIFRRVWSV